MSSPTDDIIRAKRALAKVPVLDMTDPGKLRAWYGNFGFFDHYRKSVLAAAVEIERARATMEEGKTTEARLDQLARTSDVYLDFVTTHLAGREAYEDALLAAVAAV